MASSANFTGAQELASFVLRGTERVYERPRPFKVEHIALTLAIDHKGSSIKGAAELTITRVRPDATRLRLDAVAFDITGVHFKTRAKGSWRAAKYVYDGETLDVEVPAAADKGLVRVRYRANPRRGMYFLRSDEQVKDRPSQVWTQCQDEDARYIFPCHDKPHIKQTFDIDVRVQKGWFVLSNGDLVGSKREQASGRYRYRMRQAMPSYLFTIVAGMFTRIDARVGDLPVPYYVPVGREKDGKRTFGKTPAMIRLFARLTGVKYPWTKYAQIVVSDFIFGGMENTGATTMYEHILIDERAAIDVSSDDLISHELAHQWFGDLVTCRDWSHAWLNEGFATYLEHVWRQHDLGQDEYDHGVAVDLRAYLSEANGRYQRPVVCQDYEAPIDIFDRHLYEKGALFLHTLRMKLGDELFWRGVNCYLTRHAGGVVETRDLLRAMEETSGESLEQFFEERLLRAGHAKIDVVVSYDDGLLVVDVKQKLAINEKPFSFDFEVDIATAGSRRPTRERRRVDRVSHTFAFALRKRPRYVVVDPDLRVLGRVTTKAPADMLRNQIVDAPSARGRVLAAQALSSRDDPATVRSLSKVLSSSRQFWAVRSAAASALGNIGSDEAFKHLAAVLRTRHPKVRRAVAVALGNFKTEASAKLLARSARSDESILVSSSACRALGSTKQEIAYDTLVELLDRDGWADMLRAGAIEGLARLRDDRGIDSIRERTKYGVPTRARRAAIAALPELSSSRKTRELLHDLLEDKDPHLRVSVALALGEMGDSKSRGALRRQLDRDLDGRVRRRIREVLRDLGGRSRREMRRMRESLDEMHRLHKDVTARLAKIEERLDGGRNKRRRR